MSVEHMKVNIENALDLLQVITEDVEDNFISSTDDNAVKARAMITVSSLYVLSDFLRNLCKGETA